MIKLCDVLTDFNIIVLRNEQGQPVSITSQMINSALKQNGQELYQYPVAGAIVYLTNDECTQLRDKIGGPK